MPNIKIPDRAENPMAYAMGELSPELGGPAGEFVKAIYQSARLPLRVAEGARYRTAQLNGCLVCQSFRAGDHLDAYLESVGGDTGTSMVARGGARPDEAFYQAVTDWRTSDQFDERERLAIELAERMGTEPGELGYDSAFWDRMNNAFSDSEISDLALCIGGWMALGRFAHSLGLDTVCMPGMDHVKQAEEYAE